MSGTASAQHRHAEGRWSSPGYRSGRTRAKWAEALFTLTALVGVGGVVVALNGVALANRAVGGDIPTPSELASYISTADGAGDLFQLCAVGLAVAFLAWLSRTVEIVPALGLGTPKDSPRWAIGWWFIPVAFLWKPYTVVREVWDRLAIPARATGGTLVLAWWLAWIGAVVVNRTANAMAGAESSWGTVQSGFWVSFGASALYVADAVLGFLVVRDIQARADVRAGTLGFDRAPSALPFAPAFAVAPPVGPADPAIAAPATGGPMGQGAASRERTEALRNLGHPREQGLVTEAEYGAEGPVRRSPEEHHLADQERLLADLTEQLATAEAEVATTGAEFARFRTSYLARFAPLYSELDRLEAEIARLLADRLGSAAGDADAARARAEAAEARAAESAAAAEAAEGAPGAAPAPTADLKTLYRQLAKAIHPDLATDDAERVRRTHLMAAASEAYAAGTRPRCAGSSTARPRDRRRSWATTSAHGSSGSSAKSPRSAHG